MFNLVASNSKARLLLTIDDFNKVNVFATEYLSTYFQSYCLYRYEFRVSSCLAVILYLNFTYTSYNGTLLK